MLTKEIVRQLGQLICLHGFNTNPEKPGVECLVVSRPRPEIGMASEFQFHPRDIVDEDGREKMLEPHGVVFCKGWTRAFVFITVMRLCYENPKFKEACPRICSSALLVWFFKCDCCCFDVFCCVLTAVQPGNAVRGVAVSCLHKKPIPTNLNNEACAKIFLPLLPGNPGPLAPYMPQSLT